MNKLYKKKRRYYRLCKYVDSNIIQRNKINLVVINTGHSGLIAE